MKFQATLTASEPLTAEYTAWPAKFDDSLHRREPVEGNFFAADWRSSDSGNELETVSSPGTSWCRDKIPKEDDASIVIIATALSDSIVVLPARHHAVYYAENSQAGVAKWQTYRTQNPEFAFSGTPANIGGKPK